MVLWREAFAAGVLATKPARPDQNVAVELQQVASELVVLDGLSRVVAVDQGRGALVLGVRCVADNCDASLVLTVFSVVARNREWAPAKLSIET